MLGIVSLELFATVHGLITSSNFQNSVYQETNRSHSTIRQVPDNQEVYLDTDGFASLTFDINERVSHLPTDREALEYHVADIIAEEDSTEILSVEETVKSPNFS